MFRTGMKSFFSTQMVLIFVAWSFAVSALFLPVETASVKGTPGLVFAARQATTT
jgi:hypothetical protein